MYQQVSDSELTLMKILWSAGGRTTYAAVMEALAEAGNTWQKNTVITLLSRLVDKGMLKTGKIGRRNEYAAMITQQEYQAAQTQSFVHKIYGGSAKNLICALLQQEALSAEELQEIESFWRQEVKTK